MSRLLRTVRGRSLPPRRFIWTMKERNLCFDVHVAAAEFASPSPFIVLLEVRTLVTNTELLCRRPLGEILLVIDKTLCG
jgi:hypothetical protein